MLFCGEKWNILFPCLLPTPSQKVREGFIVTFSFWIVLIVLINHLDTQEIGKLFQIFSSNLSPLVIWNYYAGCVWEEEDWVLH